MPARKQPQRCAYFKLVTGMLHPAVLGSVVVGALNLGTTLLQPERWFSVAASIALIWYFSLDYLVTVIKYRDCEEKYGPGHFVVEIILMILLLWSFNVLWADLRFQYALFFFLVSLQLLAIGVWNRLDEPANGWHDEWVWKVIVAGFVFLALAIASYRASTDTTPYLQATGLTLIVWLLTIYTRQFCKPDFFETDGSS